MKNVLIMKGYYYYNHLPNQGQGTTWPPLLHAACGRQGPPPLAISYSTSQQAGKGSSAEGMYLSVIGRFCQINGLFGSLPPLAA